MSLITPQGRVSVKPFASAPPLAGLPPIRRAQASVSDISSRRGLTDGVDLEEGCLVTRNVKYTHQLTHWINAVRRGESETVVSTSFISGSYFSY